VGVAFSHFAQSGVATLYNTSFTTDDEPNVIEGVGVLANCESIVIKSGTIM